MTLLRSGIAFVCGALVLGIAMPGSLAAAGGPGCEVTSEHAYTKDVAEPVSFDRSGNVLLNGGSGEATGVARPDGSTVWMHDLPSLDGWWYEGWYGGTMTPDGTVLSGARNWDVSEHDPGWWRAFVWKGKGLIWLKRGANAFARDANVSGMIVGYKGIPRSGSNPETTVKAVYWPSDRTRPEKLHTPARFVESKALDVDRDGTIYGTAERSDGTKVWVKWQGDDRMTTVHLPDTFNVREVANGQFVGSVTTPDVRMRPAYFDENGLWVPPIPEGMIGRAEAVTADGLFGGTLHDTETNMPLTSFVGRAAEDLRYDLVPLDNGWLTELRSFDHGSALTSDGWIISCLSP